MRCKSFVDPNIENTMRVHHWKKMEFLADLLYIEHLTHLPITCFIANTYMHMASRISLVTSVGKDQGLHAYIVLKLVL